MDEITAVVKEYKETRGLLVSIVGESQHRQCVLELVSLVRLFTHSASASLCGGPSCSG